MLTIAVAKGRIFEATIALLEQAGVGSQSLLLDSRKLILDDQEHQIRYLLAKPVDVPTYVTHGAADLGIVGKDVLHEANTDIHELVDLGFGYCQMVVAAPQGTVLSEVSQVATKYPRYARDFFRRQGRQIEIIDLHGSVELAPLIGLSDCIVDIVETGRTLKENGLVIIEKLAEISTRLVANRRSFQLKGEQIDDFVNRLHEATKRGSSH